MLLQVNMSTSAMVLKDAHRIMLKDIKASGSHRSMPVLPTAFIDGSLLSVDFLSAVTSAAVTVRNSATGEIVYSSVEMNVTTLRIDLTGKSAGEYSLEIGIGDTILSGDFLLEMDCEDKRDNSYTTGNVGATYIENGNVNFVFCLTNASRYYPGGVLLVDHINYNLTLTQEYRRENRQMDVIVCHHDAEDNNPSNYVEGNDNLYNSKASLGGYTKIDDDVTLAWGFPSNGSSFSIANYFGPAGIQYGLLSTTNAATGTIHCDDEDSNNKNWVQRYNLGYTLDNSFNESVALNDFGITENGNTTYSVSLSTDAKFSKNNRFYPSRLY